MTSGRRKLTAIEVNATYYGSFKPDTFARWADALLAICWRYRDKACQPM